MYRRKYTRTIRRGRAGSSKKRRSYVGRRLSSRRTTKTVMKRTSRRRILNISSQKKKNNAQPVNFNYLGESPIPGSKVMGSDRTTYLLWRPTALTDDTDIYSSASRGAQQIYWRGIKERAEVGTSSGAAWRWRRIVFEAKSLNINGLISNVETSAGFNRAMVELSGDPPANLRNSLESFLFQGSVGVDWNTVFNAKVDNNRCRLLSDKVRHLQSGNDRGRFYTFRQWIPLNKTMVYNDDEVGDDKQSNTFASPGRKGMGDVYVYDMFQCLTSDAINTLNFNPQATLYWHER